MESGTKQLQVTAGLINKYFDTHIPQETLPANAAEAYERLRSLLAERIAFLLANRFELLLHLFYRIDVRERDFRDVQDNCSNEEIPYKLAELVIDRQMEKAKRHQYTTGQ